LSLVELWYYKIHLTYNPAFENTQFGGDFRLAICQLTDAPSKDKRKPTNYPEKRKLISMTKKLHFRVQSNKQAIKYKGTTGITYTCSHKQLCAWENLGAWLIAIWLSVAEAAFMTIVDTIERSC